MTGNSEQRYFVPAAPGYWRLDPVRADGGFRVYREPIAGNGQGSLHLSPPAIESLIKSLKSTRLTFVT
jgi:hypothetical protein